MLIRYPNIKTKTLATLFSASNNSKIEVQEVLQAGRITKFVVSVNGTINRAYFVSETEKAQKLTKMREEAK